MNEPLRTVLIAPMTTTLRNYPTRVTVKFQGKTGQIALDQIRAIDRDRLVRKLGTISARAGQKISDILLEMFAR
jgi:mRNA interferase MazF